MSHQAREPPPTSVGQVCPRKCPQVVFFESAVSRLGRCSSARGRYHDPVQDHNDPSSVRQGCTGANHVHRRGEPHFLQAHGIARKRLDHDCKRVDKFAPKVCAADIKDQQLDVTQSAA